MNFRQTIVLLVLVLGVGGYIWLHERHQFSTEEELAMIRKAFALDPDRIQGLSIQRPAYLLELGRVGDSWTLATPKDAPANRAMVRQTLSRLGELTRGELITPGDMRDRGLSLADFGLAVPQAILRVEDSRGRTTYHIGNPDPLGTSIYVKEEKGQNIMLVSSDLLTILPEDADAFRDRQLIPFGTADIVGLSLISTGRVLRLERENADWWIRDPLRTPAENEQVSILLQKLNQARIEDFVPGEPGDLAQYGLNSPGPVIRTRTRTESVPHEIRIGHVVDGQPDRRYARIPGQGGVFMVSTGLANLAEMELDSLRNRRVLLVPPDSIQSMTLSRGNQLIRLKREGAAWTLQEPRESSASTERVNLILDLWKQARVESYSDFPSDASPDIRVTFETRTTQPDQPIAFEFYPQLSLPGRLAIRATERNELWQILPDTLKYMPLDPLHYRNPSILTFNPKEVIRISATQSGRTSTVTRVSARDPWISTDPNLLPQSEHLMEILDVASRLRAASLVEQDPKSLAVHGLDKPDLRLSIGLGGSQPVNRTLLLSGIGTSSVKGIIQGQDLVFVVDPTIALTLSQSLSEPGTPVEGTGSNEPKILLP